MVKKLLIPQIISLILFIVAGGMIGSGFIPNGMILNNYLVNGSLIGALGGSILFILFVNKRWI